MVAKQVGEFGSNGGIGCGALKSGRAHLSFWQGSVGDGVERADASGHCARRFPNKARLRLLVGSNIDPVA